MRMRFAALSTGILLAASGGLRAQEAAAPGLVLEATDGAARVVEVVPAPHFALRAEESVHPQIRPGFTATWTGVLTILRPGKYALRATAEPADAAKTSVRVDGRESGVDSIELTAGEHPILATVVREPRDVRFQLRWSSEFFGDEPVPSGVLGHREAPDAATAQADVERGRDLARELNCAGCHAGAPPGRRGPDLSRVGARTNEKWIHAWLGDPRKFRSTAVMPALALAESERRDVAAYLAGLGADKRSADGAVPEAEGMARQGEEWFRIVGCAACHGKGGVPLDGLGSKTTVSALDAFLRDPLAVDPSGRMPAIALTEKESIRLAHFLMQAKNPEFEREIGSAGDPAKGKAAVTARGCLGCHDLNDGGALKNGLAAPSWEAVRAHPDRGCLADAPPADVPRYGLTAVDRAALRAYAGATDIAPAPAHAFRAAVRSFRCTACHELDAVRPDGLPENPPPLTGAGHKLKPSWIRAVLADGKRIRPWTTLRMPHFGAANAAPIVSGLPAAAGEPAQDPPETAPAAGDPKVAEGIRMIGKGKGTFSCIACHDFRGHVSTGTRGPDMAEMAARMRPEWFRRWLRDPGRILPGTQMPSYFGNSPPAETERWIDVLWTSLSAGPAMPLPEGLTETESFVLTVKDRPLVLRTFMPDSSPRSIAVGLPGHRAYCFDAQECRVRYAWSGEFLDVSTVWSGRGGKPAIPLGKRTWTAPDGFPLRIGDPAKEPVRKFRGYDLVDNGLPEFRYDVDGVEVRQRIEPDPAGDGVVQTFVVAATPGPVWYLPGADAGLDATAEGGAWETAADGTRRFRIPGGGPVRFRVFRKKF